MITNVDHALIRSDGYWSPQGMCTGCTIGEFGCWIDSAVTRMIQTGIEHSRIPDVVMYIGAGQFATVRGGIHVVYTFVVRQMGMTQALSLRPCIIRRLHTSWDIKVHMGSYLLCRPRLWRSMPWITICICLYCSKVHEGLENSRLLLGSHDV